MEFTIDFAVVRRIVSQEGAQAQTEITQLGPLTAYKNSLQRHDQRLAGASDVNTLACKAGCSWCCHFSVDARPVEVFHIVEFMRDNFYDVEQQRLRSEIEANARVLGSLDEMQRMQKTLKCPFLADGRCTIYAARPQTCRNYHATDAAGCKQSYDEPNNFDIAPEYAPLVYQSGAAHVDAFSKAMQDAGYDTAAYELNSALAEALSRPDIVRQRFDAKQLPVFDVEGAEVPMEFIDID